MKWIFCSIWDCVFTMEVHAHVYAKPPIKHDE